MPRKNELKMSRVGKTVRLLVQGVIGWDYFGTTAREFRTELKDTASGAATIELEIDSPGGVVTEGIAMANAVLESEAEVHTYVSGMAASMGSVLLMAGDKMFIPSNALVMVHKPLNGLIGNADDMRKMADDLDKFESALLSMYMRHFKGSKEEMGELMSKETWLTAEEMSDKFNNVVVMEQELQAVACDDPIAIFDLEKHLSATAKPDEPTASGVLAWLKKHFGTGEQKSLSKTEQEQKEDEMTPEEIKALVAATVAELKAVEQTTTEEAPKAGAIPFTGDMSNPEDVQAHVEALKIAQLQASVDWSDPVSVAKYQKAVFGDKGVAPKGQSNVETAAEPDEAQKLQDREDTHNHMAKFMPKKGAR